MTDVAPDCCIHRYTALEIIAASLEHLLSGIAHRFSGAPGAMQVLDYGIGNLAHSLRRTD